MATSTNFGWTEPDDTDLVKNGASAMRTLGNAIDSSLYTISGGIAGKNKIINGDFQVWQRGTSFSSNGYSADRWYASVDAGSFTAVRSTDVPANGTYSLLLTATSATNAQIQQKIESMNMYALAGNTVTLSVWLKSTSGTPSIDYYLAYPNAADNYTSETFIASGALTGSSPSSTWTKYSVTLTLPANAKNGLKLIIYRNATTTSSTTYFGKVQLELGSTATSFQTATGNIQSELAACQRYYYRATASLAYSQLSQSGFADGTTTVVAPIAVPVVMRVAPTSVEYSAVRWGNGTGGAAISALAVSGNQNGAQVPVVAATVSGVTSNNSYRLMADNNTSAYIGISAEL